MEGKVIKQMIENRECGIYLPPEYAAGLKRYPVVYVIGGEDVSKIMESVEPHFSLGCEEFILVGIASENWNKEFSPWEAEKVFKKEESFSGEADDFLLFLEEKIKTFMDENYRTKKEPEYSCLIGYSLAGLTALYGMYRSSAFKRIGSISGSLWYDEFTSYMESNKPKVKDAKVYLSLGLNEEKSRNPRMAKVGEKTKEAFQILIRELGDEGDVILEWNPGGHFDEVILRYQKALLWLMGSPIEPN